MSSGRDRPPSAATRRAGSTPAVPPALFLLALLLLSLVLLPGAAAHANLVSADPKPNTRVDSAPERLELVFSEKLSGTYTNVEMVREDRDHVRSVTVGDQDPKRLRAELDEVPDGVYTVRWQTLSEVDGHTRSGVYLLAVNVPIPGTGSGGGGPQGPADPGSGGTGDDATWLEPVFRALGFAGASLAAGLPLFLLLVRRVGLPGMAVSRLEGLVVTGAGTASLSAVGLIASLATRIETGPLAAAATGPGQLQLLRAGLFAGALVLYLAAVLRPTGEHTPALWSTGALLSLSGLLATTLAGHAAASDQLAVAVVNDWLHQVAVSFWIAGVVGLVVLAVGRATEAVGARVVRRFSPMAVAAVVVIVATGTLATLDRVPELGMLFTTGYGWALVAKIALLVPLVALGWYHRYRVLPDLEEPGQRQRDFSRLGRSAGLEVGLMVVVLVAAGILTSLSPPLPTASAPGADGAPGAPPFASFNESGLQVDVYIKPQPVTAGFQELFVNVSSEDPAFNRSQLDAFLTLRPPGSTGEASPQEAHVLFNGTFHWGGALFTEPGNWTARLVLQGGQGEAYRYVQHDVMVPVQAAGSEESNG